MKREHEPRGRREPRGVRVYGLHAARAILTGRLDEVLRVHIASHRVAEFSDELRGCAQARLPYHVVEPDDLERLTGSVHHEGICVLVTPRTPWSAAKLAGRVGERGGHLLVLHELQNPHNIGAIMRVAAHFGSRGALITGADAPPPLAGAASRLAEGGIEAVPVGHEANIERALEALAKRRIAIVATASEGGSDLYATKIPKRVAFVFGPEKEGLSREVLARADGVVTIPGTGAIDSLNVASAVAVILAEQWRRRADEATDPSTTAPVRIRAKARRDKPKRARKSAGGTTAT